MQEEKIVDIRGTFEKFIKPDLPDMEQEEAIAKFREKDLKKAIKNSENSGDGENVDNTEEKEHFERVKKELLASLERVKKLEKQIYGEQELETKKEKHKNNKFKQEELQEQKENSNRKTKIKEVEQKER